MLKDCKISGSGVIAGGEYNVVKISGCGGAEGDIVANEISVSGASDFQGLVKTGVLKISGACEFSQAVRFTDGDISDCTGTVTVPGGVWLLFYDGVSSNLINSLKGKKMTRTFEIY